MNVSRNEGIIINLRKVKFCREEITYWGHILTKEGIKIDNEKIQAITQYPAPKNVKELQSFLGLINFCAKFTPFLSKEAYPLLQLLKNKTKWKWDEKCEQAFDKVKSLFKKEMLYHPKFDRSFILYINASILGLGAVLSQIDDNGHKRAIHMISRTLHAPEKNYFTSKLKLLAIVWALGEFRSYILGNKIIIKTDYRALSFLQKFKTLSGWMIRCTPIIQEYNVDIQYIQGRDNEAADSLSWAKINNFDEGKYNISTVKLKQINKELI